ncbi:MAG TPA: lytic polysaccharide monooxygenase, partial [Spirochaetota bacterium]|nr:lytic polysaccharide monooxygenase [Spirochaetota bacterium]
MIERFFRPFFAGVFFAPDLDVSSRSFEFVFHATAPHATRDWQLYVTRDGWDPKQPLGWGDVDSF